MSDLWDAKHIWVKVLLSLIGGIIIKYYNNTVKSLSFGTNMPGQTVQTQIRLFLKEQSDQGLHCLPFQPHLLDALNCIVIPDSSTFRTITVIISGVPIFRFFTKSIPN